MELIFEVAIFALGLCLGSFLNVCIYRLPRGLSVVAPRSACPACHTPIAAYDNIPMLSWILLGGPGWMGPRTRRYSYTRGDWQRWQQMTLEQRATFREGLRSRCGHGETSEPPGTV